jgi:hypothetical protein
MVLTRMKKCDTLNIIILNIMKYIFGYIGIILLSYSVMSCMFLLHSIETIIHIIIFSILSLGVHVSLNDYRDKL